MLIEVATFISVFCLLKGYFSECQEHKGSANMLNNFFYVSALQILESDSYFTFIQYSSYLFVVWRSIMSP